jgi:hypothetical protein
MEKKLDALQNMSEKDFAEGAKMQSRTLPPPRIVPGNQKIAERLGQLLLAAEEHRIKGSKKMPLWPMEWREDKDGNRRCTGKMMDLGRSCGQAKEQPVGSAKANVNYGRFFVCVKEPRMGDDGKPVMRTFKAKDGKDVSVPDTFMSSFQWFDETLYARSGALNWACPNRPELAQIMTSYGIAKVPTLWPDWLLDDAFRDGLSIVEVLQAWGAKKAPKNKEGEEDGDEEGDEIISEEEDEEPEPPRKKPRRRLKHRDPRVAQFIDDEAVAFA